MRPGFATRSAWPYWARLYHGPSRGLTGVYPGVYPWVMYKERIVVGPDTIKALQALKKEWGLQSHNKVIKRLLKERSGGQSDRG